MTFDEVISVAKDAIGVAGKKTNEVVSVSKLKLEIVKLNTELNKTYTKLGKLAYSMKKDGYENKDLEQSLCDNIDMLKQKISELNRQIANEQHEIQCPLCRTHNPQKNTYCAKCGAKIKQEFIVK